MIWAGVALGGAVGATARYLSDLAVRRHNPTRVPLGTLLVNVLGSLVLGLVVGLHRVDVVGTSGLSVLGAGVLGGFTTFSTFGYETVLLVEEGRSGLALANVAVSVAAALVAAALGLACGAALG